MVPMEMVIFLPMTPKIKNLLKLMLNYPVIISG